MTLDEAITHAELTAIRLGDCMCGQEHQQIAEWLKELKNYRATAKIEPIDYDISKSPYMKTIEEMCNKYIR